ncbi:hypothetical protein CKM354_001030400 [Cercospora kikuchii]|uniref:Uncharacterized protein n=1 Tax=Cercospora kikuchii TaxID=84275 RepID=A0A9P3FKT7_9PEZI|nr:uncharacterized protein CKM354_001030400 [Cercospora kikuchii]GIZ47205.1 hypothetical protein CKM354_001030400 [Cercospora kikuchii]
MSEAKNNKLSQNDEEARLDARQQQLSSYGSTDPPPAYSSHDETTPTDNTGTVSGFRAGFNALTNAISKTFCGTGSVARTSSDEKPIGDTKTLEGTGGKDKRPNKNCVGADDWFETSDVSAVKGARIAFCVEIVLTVTTARIALIVSLPVPLPSRDDDAFLLRTRRLSVGRKFLHFYPWTPFLCSPCSQGHAAK